MFQHRMLYTLLLQHGSGNNMTLVDFGLQNAKSSDGKMFLVSGHKPAPKGCFEQFAGHRLQMPT